MATHHDSVPDTISELHPAWALASADRLSSALDYAEAFTAAYAASENGSAAAREAAALRVQFPAILLPPEEGDRFAGRVRYGLVGFSPEPVGLGYYCARDALTRAGERYPHEGDRIHALLAFWEERTTDRRTRAAFPDDLAGLLPSDAWTQESGVAFPLYRMAGTTLDYRRLLRLGLDGLEELTAETPFSHVVPTLRRSLEWYRAAAGGHTDPAGAAIADTIAAILHAPPATYRQAIQLFWLYALHAGTWNYGRLDDALGPFLAADLDDGRLTEEEALDLTVSLWRLMQAYDNQFNNRVIVGGIGRSNPVAADRFALMAIEATRRLRGNQPQLSLRCSADQDRRLWERAMDAIGEGTTFPILYNDDVNVPAVARAFGVEESIAAEYTPFGCGEYVLGPHSEGSPNGVINLMKALEVALHGGVDPWSGRRVAALPEATELTSFEAVWDVYCTVVDMHVAALARHQMIEYEVVAAEAPFGFISALTAGCIEHGTGAFAGGAEHRGGTIETYGNTNTADSLHAIDELVFSRGVVSLPELVRVLDADFQLDHEAGGSGGQRETHPLLNACLAVAKYGNDDDVADRMAQRVHAQVCGAAREQAPRVGLDSYLVVIINNWANTILGRRTGAGADGRRAGAPMANGNNPTPGMDRTGPTAVLNSLAKLDPTVHAGAVQNMKFSREWFGGMRAKMDALLKTYFRSGGTQAMITVVDRGDLEAAMREPEKWGHLMVRVGGFSVRFVDLPPAAQQEILQRTLY